MRIERGDIFLADLDPSRGREIQKTRPVIVISNNVANEFSDLVTVLPLTSQNLAKKRSFEVLTGHIRGLEVPSKILVQQIRAIDKQRLVKKLASSNSAVMAKVDEALKVHLDLR